MKVKPQDLDNISLLLSTGQELRDGDCFNPERADFLVRLAQAQATLALAAILFDFTDLIRRNGLDISIISKD